MATPDLLSLRSSWTRTKRLSKSPTVSTVNASSGKRADAFGVGRPEAVDLDTSPQTTPSVLASLVGEANECNAYVDGKQCKALLDTGSQVTSISESFFKQHLSGRVIQSVHKLLKVVGVTGREVPFLGYISVNLKFPSGESGVKTGHEILALIVPDTEYNRRVPLVVGTNVMRRFKDECCHGALDQYLQRTTLSSAWKRAYRHAQHQEHFSSQCDSGRNSVKSTSRRPIAIEAHQTVVVWGMTRSVPNVPLKAILEPDVNHSGITATPSLVTLATSGNKCRVPVELTNSTPHRVELSPRAVLARVHLASEIVDREEPVMSTENVDHEFDLGDTPLTEEQKAKAREMLYRMSYVFAKSDQELGHTSEIEYEIRLTDDTPFREPYRKVPQGQLEEFRSAIQDLLDAGVIRESKSPFASPVVLVRKKTGGLRVCVDFRKLNARTIRDSYPLPRISETLEALKGARYFCTLDLQSGYLQVKMKDEDREKTAMTTPFGLFEFNRMAFGLKNAPASFQRLMERCLAGLNLRICLAYLDDIIVFGRTIEEVLERLEVVLGRLGDFGLKLKPSKCKLYQTKVCYLGHVVSKDGVEPDPEKVSALKEWLKTPPKDVSALQTFIGFASYYRCFIEGFSKIARPLHSLVAQASKQATRRKANIPFQ